MDGVPEIVVKAVVILVFKDLNTVANIVSELYSVTICVEERYMGLIMRKTDFDAC